MSLTVDQRWLLMHMGTWAIVWALASPDGVAHLMQSCWGSTTGRDGPPTCPARQRGCAAAGLKPSPELSTPAPPASASASRPPRSTGTPRSCPSTSRPNWSPAGKHRPRMHAAAVDDWVRRQACGHREWECDCWPVGEVMG